MNNKLISIVIVNYNGAEVLPGCLKSIFRQTYRSYEVILVDNASADDSVDWVKNNFPQVKLILNERNLGFAKACNQGAGLARGEYIAFLNYDTVADSDWLKHLVAGAEESRDIGACMSKILLLDLEQPTINSSGGVIHYLGLSWAGDYNRFDNPGRSQKREIAFASGAAMLVKKEVLDRINIFDEDFFMYCEDTDLSWRMRLAGYRVMYIPESLVWHKYHFSKGKQKFYFLERNRLSMLLTNYEWRSIALLAVPGIIFEIGMLINSLAGGWFRLKMRSYLDLIRQRDRLREKRKIVQSFRRRSDREIAGIFVSEIDFSAINNIFISLLNVFFRLYWKLAYRLIR